MSKKTVLKGTFILTLTGIIVRFLGFLFKIFLTRKIGSEAIGLFQMTLPIVTLCHAISISGFEITLSKTTAIYNRRNTSKMYKNAFNCTILSVSIGFLCSILLFAFAGVISKYYLHSSDCKLLLKLFSISIPFTCIHSMFYSYYIGKEKTAFPAISQLLEQAIRFLSVIFISRICKDALLAVAATLVGEIFSVILCGFLFIKSKISRKDLRISKKIMRATLKLSYPISLNRIILNAFQSIEVSLIPLMLVLFGMDKSTAISTLGMITGMVLPVILLPSTLVNSFSLMLIPVVSANKYSQHAIENCRKKAMYLSVFLGLFCIIFFCTIGAKWTAYIFKISSLYNYTKMLSLICPFLFINVTHKSILNSLDKSFNILSNNIICETICIASIVFLIPKYGTTAYISGIILSQTAGAILSVHSLNKYQKNIKESLLS